MNIPALLKAIAFTSIIVAYFVLCLIWPVMLIVAVAVFLFTAVTMVIYLHLTSGNFK